MNNVAYAYLAESKTRPHPYGKRINLLGHNVLPSYAPLTGCKTRQNHLEVA